MADRFSTSPDPRRVLLGGKHLRKAGSDVGQLRVQALMVDCRVVNGVFPLGKFPLEGGQGRFFFGKFDIVFPYGTDRLQALFAFPLGVFQRCSG